MVIRSIKRWVRADVTLLHPERYDDLPTFEHMGPMFTIDNQEGEDRFQDLDGSEPLGRTIDLTKEPLSDPGGPYAQHGFSGLEEHERTSETEDDIEIDAGTYPQSLKELSKDFIKSTPLSTVVDHQEDRIDGSMNVEGPVRVGVKDVLKTSRQGAQVSSNVTPELTLEPEQ